MTDSQLRLVAKLDDKASAGVQKLTKGLSGVKPTHGMAQAQKWFADFRGGADKTVASLRPVTGLMNSVGVGGLAASLSIAEMVKQFKELADSALSLRELSRQSRISAGDLQRLSYVASRFHIDPKAMDGAVDSWSGKMVQFKIHVGDFYNYLMRQNADVAAKIGRDSPVDALKDTLDYISRIANPQIQKQVADIAGLGGIVPVFGKGPDGLAAVFADAAREVKPMSKELQDAADRFNTSVVNFNQTWTNFENSIGPSVLDPLSRTLDKLDEGLKFAAQYPGDAAAAAATIAGSFAALYLRFKIMRGSALGSGAGLGRAASELTGAAGALRGAAAALEGAGATTGTVGTTGAAAGTAGATVGGFFARLLAPVGMTMAAIAVAKLERQRELETAKTINTPRGQAVPDLKTQTWGEFWRGAAPGSGASGPATNFDGNALHRNDEMPAAQAARDLFDKVREGSKGGIIAGLREMAQQQELGGGGSFGGGQPGHGGNAGMPNLRYGRRAAGGGYRQGPGTNDAGAGGAFNPRAPEKSGTYRPEYKLSDADLSDYVVNTVNGEATSSPESIDAVINNMMNRVGSKGWGPSGNLHDVASAPNQYAGHRPASPQAAERIRARIRAIASGGVPDNTNGSNAYRAAWYHGKWYQQHAADGRVVGGNRFAYEPWTRNGPYAPYPAAKPAADAFGARVRALNGAPPQAHASGGPIRGPGGPRSDNIFAMLSNGEFVVNARDARRHAGLLSAINSGGLPAYADGGVVAAGAERRRSWLDFFHRSLGASRSVAFGATAMMMGESGRNLNPSIYGWDVNGPSGGTAQWHDVTTGPGAGKVHRLSDLMTMAMMQHADWHDVSAQQAWWKHEAQGPLAYAWNAMRRAKTAAGTLKAGIDKFEVPADKPRELLKRLPNITRLAQETGGGAAARQVDPVEISIRHHPHTGRPIVSARAGRGVKLNIRTAPTMRPS